MAYQIDYFLRLSVPPADMLNEILQATGGDVHDRSEGAGWVNATLAGQGGGVISVEVHGQDALTTVTVEEAITQPDAPDLINVNGMVLVTLSGVLDEDLFDRLRYLLRHELHAIERDETDGFTGHQPPRDTPEAG